MVTEVRACPACGEAVPRGRFSCQGCGSLLAPVAAYPGVERSESPEPATPGAYVPSSWRPDDPVERWAPAPVVGTAASPVEPPAPIAACTWGPERDASPARAPSMDGTRIDEAAGWVAVAGSMAAVIGFLLPWSAVVIGARGFGGYTDTWGLAGPLHPVVCLVTLIAFALAAAPNPLPTWFRSGLLTLTVGPLLLGLTWPYVFGPLGAGPGVILVAVGGALLISAGITTGIVHRRAEATRAHG